MCFFLNSTKNLITDTTDGFLRCSRAPVAKLDVGSADINVIVRPDWTKEKANHQVALVTGGGSGHEPMHAGFVGEGMLTAAICGGLFASPSYEAVLSTILHVAGNAGVFLIVKAYTGDCLIFGLAVEKAKSMGIKVDMIIFSDDISIPDHPRPRGLAGTILMHKICGFLCNQKKSLEEVKRGAELAKSLIQTMGVSITSCRTPASSNDNRIPPNHAEIGLGIHGEPGIQTLETQNVDQIVGQIITKLTEKIASKIGSNTMKFVKVPIAILLNNLGGVSELEMSVICSSLLKQCSNSLNAKSASNNGEIEIDPKLLIGPASLCTSLDMKGFSITFIELSDPNGNVLEINIEEAIRAPVLTHGWVNPIDIHQPMEIKAKNQMVKKTYVASEDEKVSSIVRTICNCLISKEEELNKLDSFVGDGDTGLTFAQGSRAIISALDQKILPCGDLSSLFENVAEILDVSMGGSSGVLLSILFLQTSAGLKKGKTLQEGLMDGVSKMMELGGAKLGFRTMIDSFHPAVIALKEGIENAAKAAETGAENTKNMEKAGAGRSTYLNSQSLKGHADPGACAVAFVFRALVDLLKK